MKNATQWSALLLPFCFFTVSYGVEAEVLEKVVNLSLQVRQQLEPLTPFSQRGIDLNLEQAYRAQALLQERLIQKGDSLSGYKVGFTTKAAQERFKVPEPCAGPFFHSMAVGSGGKISLRKFMKFHIEAEIAFVLKAPVLELPENPKALIDRVASVHLAFEIPDLRFSIHNGMPTAADLVAEGMAGQYYVLGKGIAPERFDSATIVRLSRNGELLCEAPATDALGDPWNVLHWLAKLQLERKAPLQAGQLILTGTLGKAHMPPTFEEAKGHYTVTAPHVPELGSIEVIVVD